MCIYIYIYIYIYKHSSFEGRAPGGVDGLQQDVGAPPRLLYHNNIKHNINNKPTNVR